VFKQFSSRIGSHPPRALPNHSPGGSRESQRRSTDKIGWYRRIAKGQRSAEHKSQRSLGCSGKFQPIAIWVIVRWHQYCRDRSGWAVKGGFVAVFDERPGSPAGEGEGKQPYRKDFCRLNFTDHATGGGARLAQTAVARRRVEATGWAIQSPAAADLLPPLIASQFLHW
jgi:hypothetical protein